MNYVVRAGPAILGHMADRRLLPARTPRWTLRPHTAPWRSARGDCYQLIELQVPGAQGPALVGAAALRVPAGADQPTSNAAWSSATARALQEAVELSTGRPFEAWMELV
jgi:CubicO group peptidase (beta-lactamase class C family)